LPQFKRILASAEKHKLLVQMGYMFRYNPGFVKLKEFIKHGWLGDIFEVHAVMSKVVPPAERRLLAEYPGGILFELGCHVVDLVIGLLGKPKEVSGFNQHASPLDDKLLDNMLAVFKYDKAIASVKSSAQEVDGFARRQLTVCGTEGTFHIQPLDAPRGRLALSRGRDEYKAGYQDVPLPKYTRYVDDAADMARVIRGEKESEFPYDHDLAVQESLLRACHLPLDR
ncbi:MAG: Gfo/Idh/MocA family oxidoreductase, partial [Pirellulaceae bacterium]